MSRWSHYGSLVLVGMAAIGAGVALGRALSERDQARAAAKPSTIRESPRTSDAPGPLSQRLEVKEIIQRGDVQSMVLAALAQPSKEPLFVKHSVTVYDHQRQTVVPGVHSEKVERAVGEESATNFEVPEGLAEGYYYAELLTAHALHPDDSPAVSAQRVYFRVAKGELEPMTTSDWELATDEGSGASVVKDDSVEINAETDGQQIMGEQR